MSELLDPASDDLAKELLSNSVSDKGDAITEIRAEMGEYRRRRSAEEERIHKIKTPWLYETQNPMADPPDINFRKAYFMDQDSIDTLLGPDDGVHFTERCVKYQGLDLWVKPRFSRSMSCGRSP